MWLNATGCCVEEPGLRNVRNRRNVLSTFCRIWYNERQQDPSFSSYFFFFSTGLKPCPVNLDPYKSWHSWAHTSSVWTEQSTLQNSIWSYTANSEYSSQTPSRSPVHPQKRFVTKIIHFQISCIPWEIQTAAECGEELVLCKHSKRSIDIITGDVKLTLIQDFDLEKSQLLLNITVFPALGALQLRHLQPV